MQTPDNAVRDFEEIDSTFGMMGDRRIAIGVGYILSYLNFSPAHVDSCLNQVLALSRKHRLPVLIHLDGENYWGYRPDLWNWWDPAKPGYDPANKYNVEWHDWSPDSAVKLGWRNWGEQRRVLPAPNLMSPPLRQACDSAMRRLVPIVRNWWRALPDSLKYLFVGINVGWESAIGVNNWYYPNGNALLDQPEAKDPIYGLNILAFPSRAVQPIGYAAVSTLGLAMPAGRRLDSLSRQAHSGQLTAEHVAEVVRIHLEDLSKICHDLGIPREHVFTHCGGWGKGDPTSYAAVNKYSCPGWSFYDYAYDVTEDINTMSALRTSDAPYWAATEWWYKGDRGKGQMEWLLAIANTLSIPKVKYMCIYNWEAIRANQAAVAAIRVGTKFR
ncbi:MAG: hypothetical protein HY961_16615 [Ignavibacteriae bacterium]|nr:hypothetical protein [Ignavibacteriota bacterium]